MLSGKIAVVTGSTSGIGWGIAQALAAEGAGVVLNGRSEAAAAEPLLQTLRAVHDGPVSYVASDLASPEGCEALIAAAREAHGRIDILVNNAGVQHVAPVEDFPPEKWQAILDLNLSSAFHCARLVVGAMKAQRWGRIVNIASAHSLVASPYKSAYVAAKHGLLGLTKTLALETARDGITCNAICPGYVKTPLVEKQIADQAKAHGIPEADVIRDVILERQPNKEFVTVEQIGALTAFLCSDAGAGTTGTALPMDGGWTAH